MQFILLERNEKIPNTAKETVYLTIDRWNDFSYVTMFFMNVFDHKGVHHRIGNVKIAFRGQTEDIYTYRKIENLFNSKTFQRLPDGFFSLGQDVDFYVDIMKLPDSMGVAILESLNDVAYKTDLLDQVKSEQVFNISLIRSIKENTIRNQFKRVLEGKPALTDFSFSFIRGDKENIGGIKLDFNVLANSFPRTNIHTMIGRNGVGKTTILNGITSYFIDEDGAKGYLADRSPISWYSPKKLNKSYFSSLISISFSVFDPFTPNNESNKSYSYIGLKKLISKPDNVEGLERNNIELKSPDEYFRKDFLKAFSEECKPYYAKRARWLNAIKNLESDSNFAEMNLSTFMNENIRDDEILAKVKRMSSGHASVLLIMTQLVSKVEEKTLVLIDEPESHLHPPLLSAFVRALSDLLDNRNGVAIIATHSPVVLQEIPSSCVWKIERTGKRMDAFRPNIETFGENVGVLTREVFGLEVSKSGFYKILAEEVEKGKNYDEVLTLFKNQLGTEARLLLRVLIRNKELVE